MKIAIIIDNTLGAGGGYDQALNAIKQMKRICEGRFDLEVFSLYEENASNIKGLGLNCTSFKYTIIDKLIVMLGTNTIWHALQTRLKVVAPLEKKLIKHNCDLVYFVTSSGMWAVLQKLNYIITIWDMAHRDMPEFPEIREFNKFQIHENLYKNYIASAFLIITDSKLLSEKISFQYGILREKFIEMPFSPSQFISNVENKSMVDTLKQYQLEEGYFYYPAQFWPHKNHIRILQAPVFLNSQYGWNPVVVFSGKDYGNLGHIDSFIEENKLGDQVKVLGFVASENIKGLYQGAMAVVMPTYFGPTNLPPLEAWTLSKPLIYSKNFVEQAGDAAYLIDPDDYKDIAKAMLFCKNHENSSSMIEKGHKKLLEIDEYRKSSEVKLSDNLARFEARRNCWI